MGFAIIKAKSFLFVSYKQTAKKVEKAKSFLLVGYKQTAKKVEKAKSFLLVGYKQTIQKIEKLSINKGRAESIPAIISYDKTNSQEEI